MRLIPSLVLALIFSWGFSKTTHADSIPKQKRVALQIAPLSFLDFNNGSCYKLGTEIRVTKRFYLSIDGGGYLPNFNVLKHMKGSNLDLRIKYHFPNSNSRISVNYFYKKQTFEYHDFYMEEPDVPITVYTSKKVSCINLNYEYTFTENYPFYITAYAGLGVRFRNVQSSFETHHDFDRLVHGGDSQSLYFVLIPGQDTWFNVNLGFRLGLYLF